MILVGGRHGTEAWVSKMNIISINTCAMLCAVNAVLWRWGAYLIENDGSVALRSRLVSITRPLTLIFAAAIVGLYVVAVIRGKLKVSDLLWMILAIGAT